MKPAEFFLGVLVVVVAIIAWELFLRGIVTKLKDAVTKAVA